MIRRPPSLTRTYTLFPYTTLCRSYADRFTPDNEREGGDTPDGEPRSIPFLKRFVVFNAAQCDGLPERLTADPMPLPAREQHDSAEALIAATGADFRTGEIGSAACRERVCQ